MVLKSRGYQIFCVFNIIFFILISLTMIVPFFNVICLSLEPEHIAMEQGVLHLIPRELSLEAYRWVLGNQMIGQAFLNSVFITVVGSLGGVVVTAMLGYGLSFRNVMGNKLISYFVLFTMMFSSGIIPSYMLVKNLRLLDSLWGLTIPVLINAYNTILMRTFFESLPPSLTESALLDGATEMKIFAKIVIPLSTPIFATILLFYAVARWNDFFTGSMYITSVSKKPLQVVLRELLLQVSADANAGGDTLGLGVNLKMAVAIITMVPIICVYPFLQKYFTKGILLGAVKG